MINYCGNYIVYTHFLIFKIYVYLQNKTKPMCPISITNLLYYTNYLETVKMEKLIDSIS